MNWVAPCLADGLGNRIFQYACAKAYAEKYKKKLVFFLPRTRKTGHGKFENIFKLFPEVEVLETDNSWSEILEDGKDIYNYNEIEYKQGPLVIRGYRQNYKYFSSTIIKPNFENCISKERLLYLNKKYLQYKEELFFIHVRLGDYRFLTHHQIDIASYYNNAMKLIPSNSDIIVFSDDIEFAKQLLPNFSYCEETDELENLYLMSNCLKGSIVANSTFSYWGSYFAHANNQNHIAIYPYKLGNGLPESSGYIPEYAFSVKF
jgi:hypothetical protein